jgi:hypothetical protein
MITTAKSIVGTEMFAKLGTLRTVLVFSLACFGSIVVPLAQAQSHGVPVVRDPNAVAAVNAALLALGSEATFANIHDVKMNGSCSFSAEDDGAGSENSSQFSWIVADKEFRYESVSATGSDITISGHGKPTHTHNGTVEPISMFSANAMLPYQLPGLVLARELNDAKYQMKYLGIRQLSANQVFVIEIALAGPERPVAGSAQTWFFSATTAEPIAVDYLMPSETSPRVRIRIRTTFASYQAQAGVSFPSNVGVETEHAGSGLCAVNQIQINTSPASSIFDNAQGDN